MRLSRDEREYIEDWDVHRKSKKKYVRGGAFQGLFIGIISSGLQPFDSRMEYHAEEFSWKYLLFMTIPLTIFTYFMSWLTYNYKEKRYQKIIQKQK